MLQNKPQFDFSNSLTKLFKGEELLEPSSLMDISFFDNTTIKKISKKKLYKCWYLLSKSANPIDNISYIKIIYIEEVPKDITEKINTIEELRGKINELENFIGLYTQEK